MGHFAQSAKGHKKIFQYMSNVVYRKVGGRLLYKLPHIGKDKTVECFDMVTQNFLCEHIGSDVTVINTIQRIKFYGISFEMSG